MTDAVQPSIPPAAAPKTFWQRASRWIMGVAGGVLILSGAIKFAGVFFPSLPACDSDTATAVLRNIFKEKNVELTSLTGITTVSSTSSEKTCQGQAETPREHATINYRVYWEGSDVMVRIGTVDARPK
jgi:hypothetical protein